MGTDGKTRQQLYRERQAKLGHKRLTVYLPNKLVTAVDREAKARGVARDVVLVERLAAPRATMPAGAAVTGDATWLGHMVGVLEALGKIAGESKSAKALGSLRTAHQSASQAYEAMPAGLRVTEQARRFSYLLGRLDVVLGRV